MIAPRQQTTRSSSRKRRRARSRSSSSLPPSSSQATCNSLLARRKTRLMLPFASAKTMAASGSPSTAPCRASTLNAAKIKTSSSRAFRATNNGATPSRSSTQMPVAWFRVDRMRANTQAGTFNVERLKCRLPHVITTFM